MLGRYGLDSTNSGVSNSNSGTLLQLSTHPDGIVDYSITPPEPPDVNVADRIYFLFNNVTTSNAKEKSNELATILSEERILPWFAVYLVNKRIPVEQAFHEVFAIVLDNIQERVPNVRSKVMQELIRYIKVC